MVHLLTPYNTHANGRVLIERAEIGVASELTQINRYRSVALTETILLGNVAMRVGKKLQWNRPKLKVTNAPEAAK